MQEMEPTGYSWFAQEPTHPVQYEPLTEYSGQQILQRFPHSIADDIVVGVKVTSFSIIVWSTFDKCDTAFITHEAPDI